MTTSIIAYVTFGVYSVNDRPTLLWRGWPSVVHEVVGRDRYMS